ncbi:NAD(P)-dependent oxidoreductase [Candidatus Pacearchaeota archaeon]|nr:NAD(P)-dependent oxidoreductase [Candidatus Pacearchaeota archaeon]
MEILITGIDGFLGKKLFDILKKKYDVFGISRRNAGENIFLADISEKNSIEKVIESVNPDVLVHSAALVDVETCEIEKTIAYKTNAEAMKIIAQICQKKRIKLVYFSSDYVFDGNPEVVYEIDSPRNPINYYGITKKAGEDFIFRLVQNHLIVRPTILYGFNNIKDRKNFVKEIIKKLERGSTIELDDQRKKYPLLIDDVAHGLVRLINTDSRGVFHMSGPDEVTKFQFGKIVAKVFSLDEELIVGKDLRETNRPYKIRFSDESMMGMHKLIEGLEIVRSQMNL